MIISENIHMQVTSTVQTLLHMNYTITSAERRGEGNGGGMREGWWVVEHHLGVLIRHSKFSKECCGQVQVFVNCCCCLSHHPHLPMHGIKNIRSPPGVVAHAFNPHTRKAEQVDLCQFEACVVPTVSSIPAKVISEAHQEDCL